MALRLRSKRAAEKAAKKPAPPATAPADANAVNRAIVAILVDNEPGVLARVVGLFSGRGYNIESLTVAEVNRADNLSRITIVTSGTAMIIEQIKAQLARLVPVHTVRDLTAEGPHVERELALIKVAAPATSASKPCASPIFSAPAWSMPPRQASCSRSPARPRSRFLYRADGAAGPGRCFAHRHRRDFARRRERSRTSDFDAERAAARIHSKLSEGTDHACLLRS